MLFGVVYTTTVSPSQWLIWMQADFFVTFVIALIFTVAIFLIPERTKPQPELMSEIQDLKTRLDSLTKTADEIKKAIED
jgi:cell division protein FtsL